MKPESYDPEEDRDEDEVALLEEPPPLKSHAKTAAGKAHHDFRYREINIDEVARSGMGCCLVDDELCDRWRATKMPGHPKCWTIMRVAAKAYADGDCATMRLVMRTVLTTKGEPVT